MRRKKTLAGPSWTIWEGDNFPRQFHSDSVILCLMEDIFIDADPEYRVSLARQIQKEGLSESLGEAFGLIDSGRSVRGGVYYEDGDDKYPVYCELDDDLIEINATFVEVPFVF